ncbi:MAG: cyclic pyranopterin monophosphate synthase MoaC [Chloroflexota bacterium]|nr:cyclic pyranopterin monophosphate synthase MoaC [Chloroflexota bacterium]MDQ5865139.1 cyclic pyranopterin monophosphate synthase MoaC [Chloroflexota bacterium]
MSNMQDEQGKLTHLDESGHAVMVDVGAKPDTERVAVARGEVRLSPETLSVVREGRAAKGDVLAVARVAGIMAAKKTPELIPLCHPIMLTSVKVEFALKDWGIEVEARAKTTGPTGVEMEALTAVSVAALTIYDMLKAIERGASIENIRLVRKEGGKSGTWEGK